MTRRRFHAPPSAFDDRVVTLSAEEARHARDVLRLRPGDEVYVFDGAGKEFQCEIRKLTESEGVLNLVAAVSPAQPESPLDLRLAVVLLKGEKFDLVVQKFAELGVVRITPLLSARADVRFRDDGNAKRRSARWQRIALEATKQCGRARVMQVEDPIPFSSLIGRTEDAEWKIMFAERAGSSFAEIDIPTIPKSILAVVGSEGGWADEEIEMARAANWSILTLGGRTLRAETAAIVAAALLQNRFGDLK